MTNEQKSDRMLEMMILIDSSIQLADNHRELLMLASAMLQRSTDIFDGILTVRGRKILYEDVLQCKF
ncbi:hypothetical protein EB001_03190 [bacterium]|nr:hypothetical protein [bacterium]